MRLVQDDDVIETLSSDRADHALDERILPGTRRRGHDLGDAHARHAALEGRAVNSVAIPVKPAGCRVVRKGLDHLLRSPLGGRMRRGVEMEDAPSMVGEHDDDEEHPSRESRHREEVHRRGRREVIRQEGPPRLRWRTGDSCQQTRHGAFRHVDAEGTQLAVDPGLPTTDSPWPSHGRGRRISRATGGRPFARGAERRVHRRRSHVRCQPMTVSGRTSTSAVRQFLQTHRKAIQNSRSRACKRADCSPASSPSAAAGAPGSPGPVLDVPGVPAPAHDRRPSTTGACLDPGWRGRQNQLGRVLTRVRRRLTLKRPISNRTPSTITQCNV